MTRVVLVVAVFALAALAHQAHAQDGTPPPETCAAYVTPSDGVLTISGVGGGVTEPVELRAGNVIISVNTDYAFQFAAWFYRWPGEGSGPSTGSIGETGVKHLVGTVYEAGSYVLVVDARDGAVWTIALDWG